MRYLLMYILLIHLFITMSCQTSHEKGSAIHQNTLSHSPLQPEEWRYLGAMENQILNQPENAKLIAQFLMQSVDSTRGFIHAVGYHIITPSNLTSGLQLQLGEQAAFMDAQRWATYVQHWLKSSPQSWQMGEVTSYPKLPVHYKNVWTSRDTIFVYVTFLFNQESPLSKK